MNQKRIKKEINYIGKNQEHEWNKFKFISFEGTDKYGANLFKIKRLKNNDEKISKISELKKTNPFNIRSYLPKEFIEESVNFFGKKFKENSFVFIKIIERNSKNINILIQDSFQKQLCVRYCRLIKRNSNPFLKSSDNNIKEISRLGKKESIKLFHFDFVSFDKKKRIYMIKNNITSEQKSFKFHQIKKENYFKKIYIFKSEIIKKLKKVNKTLIKVTGWSFHLPEDEIYRLDNFTKFYYTDDSFKQYQTNGLFFNRILKNKSTYRTKKDIIKELNYFGNNFDNDYEKFKINKILDNKKVIVENIKTGEIETTSLESLIKKSNPFNSRSNLTLKRIINIVNELGSNPKLKEETFVFSKMIIQKNNRHSKIIMIKNKYSGVLIKTRLNFLMKGGNPFRNHLPHSLIKEKINKIGKSQKDQEKFEFLRIKKYLKSTSESRVYIKNIFSGEIKESSYKNIVKGLTNPFNLRSKLSNFEIERRTNEIGQNQEYNEKFVFIKKYKYLKNKKNLQIVIENLSTKKRKITNFNSLIRYQHSPFSKIQDLDEIKKVHPKIRTILKEMNLSYEPEVKITKRSKLDFLIYLRNKKVLIIEAKSDKKHWTKDEITFQIKKYNEDGKEKFGDNFIKTILVSPKGRYGISLIELQKELDSLIKEHQ